MLPIQSIDTIDGLLEWFRVWLIAAMLHHAVDAQDCVEVIHHLIFALMSARQVARCAMQLDECNIQLADPAQIVVSDSEARLLRGTLYIWFAGQIAPGIYNDMQMQADHQSPTGWRN